MKLSTALRGNAAFTAICAGICIAAPDWVTVHSALPGRIWALGLGAMLALFVPMLLFASTRPSAWLVKTIIALDWAYVMIATAFLLTHLDEADAIGIALMIVTIAVVSVFARLQMRGLAAMPWGARA
ncbi:MAG: hypothetical protein U0989_10750 [Azonexus sp.]|nr:hypothetical protein [Azonexus sp.]